jgi:hypothetical protein
MATRASPANISFGVPIFTLETPAFSSRTTVAQLYCVGISRMQQLYKHTKVAKPATCHHLTQCIGVLLSIWRN